MAAASASVTAAAAFPSASARRPARLPVRVEPGQLADQARGRGERHRRGSPRGHLPQPRRHALPGHAQLLVTGRESVPAPGAVIPGPPQRHGAEHRVCGLVPVAGEHRLVPLHALRARAAVARVSGQQRLQQPAPQLGNRRPDRQFGLLGARPAGQRQRRRRDQPFYLGGCLRCEPGGELIAEPFFCPPRSGAWPAPDRTGRASQIASFTSAI